jgi:hypothetical protein
VAGHVLTRSGQIVQSPGDLVQLFSFFGFTSYVLNQVSFFLFFFFEKLSY